MAGNTQNLGLYYKEPIKDGNDTFNIQTMLNDNWNKLDAILSVLSQNKLLSDYITERLNSYVNTSEKGAANGVATLGEDSKVPSSQLPDMDYVKSSEKGAANGVATLGSDQKVPDSQMPDSISRSESVSYTGKGYAGASSVYHTIIVFSFLPKVVFISGDDGTATFVIHHGSPTTTMRAPSFWVSTISTTPSENSFYTIPLKYKVSSFTEDGVTKYSFHVWTEVDGSNAPTYQFNRSGVTYTAVAIG